MSRVDMKIVLLGKEFSGKTSLVERYMHDRFVGDAHYQSTIGAAFAAKKVKVEGRSLTLGIWDTAGSERYESMSRIYYRGARAAIVCYDLTDRTTYERASFWVKELKQNEEKCRVYLCGTKLDLVQEERNLRQVDYHTVTDYADEINSIVFETSSKTGGNIKELFDHIVSDYIKNPTKPETADDDQIVELKEGSSKLHCCSGYGHKH